MDPLKRFQMSDAEAGGRLRESDLAPKQLTPAAQRALAEAAERRKAAEDADRHAAAHDERGGPAGLEPTRYGDWERKGVAVDF